MDFSRNTYAEVNLNNIENNLKKIIKKYSQYKYFFGVIKADSYGHGDISTVQAMIDGGCNYIAVATLEEALKIREVIKSIPILCFGLIPKEYIEICKDKNISITVSSLNYLSEIESSNLQNLKVHIKINSGMNRLRHFQRK